MKFLVITDLHQKKSRIDRINRIIKARKPDFTLFLGDVTDMGTGEDAASLIKLIDSKVYVIPGNCDSRDRPSRSAVTVWPGWGDPTSPYSEHPSSFRRMRSTTL